MGIVVMIGLELPHAPCGLPCLSKQVALVEKEAHLSTISCIKRA